MRPLIDNGKTSRYTYNAAGERIMKSYGTMEGVYINGAPQGITFHETDNFTLYPASIISINNNRFTKHYFIGDKRVASRIGTGLFYNVYGRNGSYVTVGQQDYAERINQIQTQKEAYYQKVGVAPGVPTERVRMVTRRTLVLVIMPFSQNSATMMCHRVGFRLHILTRHQAPTPVPLSHRMTRATLMTHRLDMATFQTTQRRRSPSSITVTTSAAHPTSQTTEPTSPSMMLTCRMANY